jgi:hypothetical protein
MTFSYNTFSCECESIGLIFEAPQGVTNYPDVLASRITIAREFHSSVDSLHSCICKYNNHAPRRMANRALNSGRGGPGQLPNHFLDGARL